MNKINYPELPKWPQCVINGENVTKEQALEIIKRTDFFFSSSFSMFYTRTSSGFEREILNTLNINIENVDKFIKVNKIIRTNFITNNWVACTWVGGYHGWCSPEGEIGYQNNIGKYPTIEDVLEDWKKISAEFPFLELTCTLMDGEETEFKKISLVTIKVSQGNAWILDKPIPAYKLKFKGVKFNIYNFNNIHYFSLEEIKQIWTAIK